MLPAGKLDRRVRFERRVSERNSVGNQKADAFEHLCDRSAWVQFGTGQERRQAAQDNATAPATFRVRRDQLTRQLKPRDRLRFDPVTPGDLATAPVWDIVSAVPWEREAIDVAAVRKA
jgi:head-tail adaptor